MGGSDYRRFPSPFRYPGGKRKVANFLKLVVLRNDLAGREYVEPYAGGASVALSLLFGKYVDRIHINDLNRSVHAFWKVVLEQPDALCARIQAIPVTMEERERQRAVQADADADDLNLAVSTFFLNRTSRSGIISGGVIGGRKQTGRWKIDARFNRADLILRIQRIARFRGLITLTGMDAAEYLRSALPTIADPLLYLDPPYYVKGAGLYENWYRDADHEEIAQLVRGIEEPWIVSYDAVPQIERLYVGFRAKHYDLSYSAGVRQRGDEVMFFSPRLAIPSDVRPCGVEGSIVAQERRRHLVRAPAEFRGA